MWIENFKETENSDNRKRFLNIEKRETLTIGGTCTHTFKLPFVVSDLCKYFEVVYKQGIGTDETIWVTKGWSIDGTVSSGIEIIEDTEHSSTMLNVTLNPLETQNFRSTLLDTYVQIKVITTDDKIFFDHPHYIYVETPLKVEQLVGE